MTKNLESKNEQTQNKISLKDKIIGTIFLIWFIASLAGMMLVGNAYYMLMIFGQYFLVFGLIALFNKALIGWLFFFVGLIIILIPLSILHPNLIPITIDWIEILPLLIGVGFILIGIGFIIVPLVEKKREKKSIVAVEATITDVLIDVYAKNKNYRPVYEYIYEGKTYTEEAPTYFNEAPNIGDTIEISIFSDEPEVIYTKEVFGYNILLFIGGISMLIGLVALGAFFFT